MKMGELFAPLGLCTRWVWVLCLWDDYEGYNKPCLALKPYMAILKPEARGEKLHLH